MELSDLLVYARETWHIEEQRKGAYGPGFSVLCHPDTGKEIAVCMREYDSETGELIEMADLKCDQSCLREFRAPFLTYPKCMRGYHWIGVRFDYTVSEAIVHKLFDRAVQHNRPYGYTVVLGDRNDRTDDMHKDTALPFSGASYRKNKAEIPEKIRQMRKMNSTLGDLKSIQTKTFYRQAVFMEDYEEEDIPFEGDFRHYFPTYRSLSDPQLRAYFSWRTKIRKGICTPIPISAVYIYLYELLNGIGTQNAEDRLKKIREFTDLWFAFCSKKDYDLVNLKRNAEEWILSLGIRLGLSPKVIQTYSDHPVFRRDAVLEKLLEPEKVSDAELFEALQYFADKNLAKSPLLTNEPERGIYLFAHVWRSGMDPALNDRRTIFQRCFTEPKTARWYPLVNAVYYEETPPEDTDYVLNPIHSFSCRNGIWTTAGYNAPDQKTLSAVLRNADCFFRRHFKTGRYLKDHKDHAWADPFLQAAVDSYNKMVFEASRPKVTIDLSGLDQIRKDALSTQNSLMTDAEEPGNPVSSDETPEPVVSAEEPDLPVDRIQLEILRRLLRDEDVQALIREHHLMPALIADQINEAFYDEIGDTVLLCEDDMLTVVEDYRQDLNLMIGGN